MTNQEVLSPPTYWTANGLRPRYPDAQSRESCGRKSGDRNTVTKVLTSPGRYICPVGLPHYWLQDRFAKKLRSFFTFHSPSPQSGSIQLSRTSQTKTNTFLSTGKRRGGRSFFLADGKGCCRTQAPSGPRIIRLGICTRERAKRL